jgi:hypothetical protein
MRQSIQDLTRLTMPEWLEFKKRFSELPPGVRLSEIAYSKRLLEEQVSQFRDLLVGRRHELDAIHDELKARGK